MPLDSTLGPASFTVTVAPARAAYLIAPGSRDGLQRAVREATSRWGGLSEPIIPLPATEELDGWMTQVLELAAVDGLVLVDADQGRSQTLADALGLQLTEIRSIDRGGPTRFSINPASVQEWKQDANPPVIAGEDAPLWQLVAAGDLEPKLLAEMARQGNIVRRELTEDVLGRSQLTRSTLIHRTLAAFEESFASGGLWSSSAVVWFCGDDDFEDALQFWNIRALAPIGWSSFPMLILPATAVENWLGIAEQVQALLIRPDEFSPDVHVTSLSVPEDRLHQLAGQLGLRLSNEPPRRSHTWPAELRNAPFTYRIDLDARQPVVFDRRYGRTTEVEAIVARPGTRLRVVSPVRFDGPGLTYLRISSSALDGLPRRASVAEMLVPSASWGGQELQIATHAQHDYRLDLTIPSLPEVVELLLTRSTETHTLSDKGRLGASLRDHPRGLSHLLLPGVVESAQALATPRSRALLRELRRAKAGGADDGALTQLALTWGGRSERRYRSAAEVVGEGGSLIALEELVTVGWAQRGLEVKCGHCGVWSFVPMVESADQPLCPGCRSAQSYSTTSNLLDVKYRLTTFIDRCCDQGMMPPLTAVAHLSQEPDTAFLAPGLDVVFRNGQVGEVDLFGVSRGSVLAGEAKTSAAAFTREQVARDVEISKLLSADVHLMVCLEPLAPDVVRFAGESCRDVGIELRTFDRTILRRAAH